MKVFLASPLGFMESSRPFISRLQQKLVSLQFEPVDPWAASPDLERLLTEAMHLPDQSKREKALHSISMQMAERNYSLLRSCQGVLAVLDGSDVDSGTASEIGCAFALGSKVINGYRGDFRRSGENDGVLVNLQVQYWIEKSGGRIYTSLKDLDQLTFTPVPQTKLK
ncbi:MAG: nucleoside 2-deoxyribosyltransferase [bacterium]|jgi:nucleoside 2-deoxyribosyltransferase|nr:nucleoside 2-deoxyribosyltransferase [bacterium]